LEDQAVHVVGETGQGEFGLRPGQADRADEQAEAVLLMGKETFDARADRGSPGIGARRYLGIGLTAGMAAVDPAGEYIVPQPFLVALRAVRRSTMGLGPGMDGSRWARGSFGSGFWSVAAMYTASEVQQIGCAP
jgi:hypothetical protein